MWKKTCSKLSASKNCRMVQVWIRLVLHEIIGYKGKPFSPFSLMNLYLILHYYNCMATTLSCHFRNIEV